VTTWSSHGASAIRTPFRDHISHQIEVFCTMIDSNSVRKSDVGYYYKCGLPYEWIRTPTWTGYRFSDILPKTNAKPFLIYCSVQLWGSDNISRIRRSRRGLPKEKN